MSVTFRTVRKFNLPYEAHLARGLLEAEGIESFIADEYTVGLNWHITPALGGVRLQVRNRDLEKASEILNLKRPAEEMEKNVSVEEGTIAGPACPKCGSKNFITKKYALLPSIIITFLVALPVPFPKKRYECQSCRNTWKSKQ